MRTSFASELNELLSEVKRLSPMHSTFQDAMAVLHKHKNIAKVEPGCSDARCEFIIPMQTGLALAEFLFRTGVPTNDHNRAIWFSFSVLGIKRMTVWTSIVVVNGIVESKDFHVIVYKPDGFSLSGSAYLGNRLELFRTTADQSKLLFRAPGGCTRCMATYAEVPPNASIEEITKAFDFNFSCITRFRPCRKVTDLMPSALNFYGSIP